MKICKTGNISFVFGLLFKNYSPPPSPPVPQKRSKLDPVEELLKKEELNDPDFEELGQVVNSLIIYRNLHYERWTEYLARYKIRQPAGYPALYRISSRPDIRIGY